MPANAPAPSPSPTPSATPTSNSPQVALATPANIDALAQVIMSEASVGNDIERTAVGFTVLNRMARNGTSRVQDVWGGYAHSQQSTPEIRDLAEDLLQGHVTDPTNGATHYYSPRSMPDENATAEQLNGYDIGGGLEQIEGLPARTYRPSWSAVWPETQIPGVRATRYRFYTAPGSGRVR